MVAQTVLSPSTAANVRGPARRSNISFKADGCAAA
jgi:hypothetical protein